MIRQKAVAEYIETCRAANLSADTILDQLEVFVTNATCEFQITEVEILEEGEVIN